MKGKNSAGDDFPIATLMGMVLLDSTGDNSSNSTGDNLYTPLGMTRLFSADGR